MPTGFEIQAEAGQAINLVQSVKLKSELENATDDHAPGQCLDRRIKPPLRQDGQATAVWVLDTATMSVKSQPVQVAGMDGNEAVIGKQINLNNVAFTIVGVTPPGFDGTMENNSLSAHSK